MEIRGTMCCGVHEFSGVMYNTPEKVLEYICKERYKTKNRVPFIIFTDVMKHGYSGEEYDYGKDLFAYIETHDLGKVSVTKGRKNPNSKNKIRVGVWQIKKKKLKEWYNEHFPKKPKEE